MENEKIRQYVMSQEKIEAPELQHRFDLSYVQIKEVLSELVQDGELEFDDGVTYNVIRKEEPKKAEEEPQQQAEEKLYVKALWECVKHGVASISLIQCNCNCSFNVAGRALIWMEENGYIPKYNGEINRRVLLTTRDFLAKFSDLYPEAAEEEETTDKEPDEYSKEMRACLDRLALRVAEHRAQKKEEEDVDDIDEDTDDDDDRASLWDKIHNALDNFDGFDDDDDEEDEEDEEDDDDDQDFGEVDLKDILMGSFERSIDYYLDKENCILDLDDETQARFKLVYDYKALKISDGGKTLAQSHKSKQKIKNVLKGFERVVLDGEEISVTIGKPSETLVGLLTLYSAIVAVKKMK